MILSFFRKKRLPTPIDIAAEQTSGGIYKRIDENRELLELLRIKAPEFLAEHFWVEGWLKAQDEFLAALEPHVVVDRAMFKKRDGADGGTPFPRPWPAS